VNDLPRRYRFERELAFEGFLDPPLPATCVGAPAGDTPRAFQLELRVAPAAWRRIWEENLFHLSPLCVPDGAALPPTTDATSTDEAPVRLLLGLHPALLARLAPEEEGDRAVLEGLLGPGPSPYKSAFAWRALKVLWLDAEEGEGEADVYVGWTTEW